MIVSSGENDGDSMRMTKNDVKDDLRSVHLPEIIVSSVPDRNYLRRRIIAIFWFVAVVLGLLHMWAARHAMNSDGVVYLDMGDAYLRGDWKMAINASWSPLYSWLLGLAMFVLRPSSYWQFSVVHLVNFLIYLIALGSFHFFLHEVIRYNQSVGSSGKGCVTLPEWAWLVLGYTLFVWSSLKLITISVVGPDMGLAAFVYLAAGMVLRIHTGSASWPMFVLLGLVLGLGYLAKTPLFPLAFVFLGVSLFAVGNLRKAVPRVLVALLVFLSLAGPFIVAISVAKGRLTIGDSGRLNYAWFVSGVTHRHWQGGPTGSGTPRHPVRKVFDEPAMYEFGTPIGGTYPPHYDSSYWYEGVVPRFDLQGQMRVLALSGQVYYDLFFESQGVLIVGLLILLFMGRRRWGCVQDIAAHWSLLIPAIAALGMYSLVHVEPRYVAAFVVLFWAGLFSGVALPESPDSSRLVAWVTIAMVTTMMIAIGGITVRKAYSAYRDLMEGEDASAHVHWQVADGLNRLGVQPGDRVAVIGWGSWMSPWARLARVQIVAEIPHAGRFQEGDKFWTADHSVKSEVINTLARTGAKVIVAQVPSSASTSGWQRIEHTEYYAHILPR
ncbi:MAG: hypothetical protein ACREKR_00495 [Candidatus Methylomirabilales bacterium]